MDIWTRYFDPAVRHAAARFLARGRRLGIQELQVAKQHGLVTDLIRKAIRCWEMSRNTAAYTASERREMRESAVRFAATAIREWDYAPPSRLDPIDAIPVDLSLLASDRAYPLGF